VILLFWTTDCVPCKRELIELEEVHSEYGERGLVVAAVCTDPENLDAVRTVVERLGISYPVLLDREARVAGRYGVTRFPTTVVVDRRARLAHREEGFGSSTLRALRARVEALLQLRGGTE
jgi:peroxiredoxin